MSTPPSVTVNPAATPTTIAVTAQADVATIDQLGVLAWPTWSKEPSEFPWIYDEPETCYFLAGRVTVTPVGGEPVTIGQGDLVTFPAGMACTWTIHEAVRKHYRFG